MQMRQGFRGKLKKDLIFLFKNLNYQFRLCYLCVPFEKIGRRKDGD